MHSKRIFSRRDFVKAAAAAGLLLPSSRAWARPKPFFETADLYEAGVGGYATYRIPGIVATAKGTLLAYCEARKSAGGDWGDIDVHLRRSVDGGRTWSPTRVLVDVKEAADNPVAVAQNLGTDEGAVAVNNPVMITDRTPGMVHFLYCVEYARCYYMRSDDDGLTFSEPTDITATFEEFRPVYDWKVIATGPGHGIQTRRGRLLVPIWMSLGTGEHAHRPSAVSTVYSDDGGRTWHAGDLALENGKTYTYPDRPGAQAFVNPSETAAVELADGRIMLNGRTESPEMRRAVTTSSDGVRGWTTPVFDEQLYEPICFGSMVRLSEQPRSDRNRLLFVNPDSGRTVAEHGIRARRNVTVKLSYDEGDTWPVERSIEPDLSGYADLAAGADGTIYCLFERGGIDGNAFRSKYLTLARFNLEWLTRGQDRLG